MNIVTNHQLNTLLTLSLELSCQAPERFSEVGFQTSVQRETIRQLRELLDEIGFDWRSIHKSWRRAIKGLDEGAKEKAYADAANG